MSLFVLAMCHVISNKIVINLNASYHIKGIQEAIFTACFAASKLCYVQGLLLYFIISLQTLEPCSLVSDKCSKGYKWLLSPGFCRHFGDTKLCSTLSGFSHL